MELHAYRNPDNALLQLNARLCHQHALQRPGLLGTALAGPSVQHMYVWQHPLHAARLAYQHERLELNLLQPLCQ